MSLYSDVRAILKNDAGVVAAGTKEIYLGLPSQEAPLPFVAMSVIFDNPQNSLQGEDTLTNITLQIDAWARDLDQAHALYAAIKSALGAATFNGGSMQVVRTGYRDIFDADTRQWRASSDWSTWSQS